MKAVRSILEKLENAPAVLAIKSGLIMIIPALMIGSATLVFKYFPISQYQQFIETVLAGKLSAFFDLIYNATFGMLSVFLTCTISFCYARQFDYNRASLTSPITSMICFFILSGVQMDTTTWDALGVKGVFLAIISALLATKLLRLITSFAKKKTHGYTEDTDIEFNHSVSMILPAAAVVAVFALVNTLVTTFFHTNSVFELFVNTANAVFLPLGRSFFSGILMVIVSSFLWFLGIHGSDVLESVMDHLFTPAIDINASLVAAGQAPTEIFTKQFFDIFVLMGGCGTAICLLLAVLLYSKRRRNRRLSRLAAIPMVFNINELMIFGFPVIFNSMLFLPFVLTPLFSFLTTFLSMRMGWVPLTISEVNWTAPVLLSGYMATGSVAGSILQLFNIIAGVLIYRPFIKAYDRHCDAASKKLINELVDMKKDSEATLDSICLTKLTDRHGALARSLASDLKYAIAEGNLCLHYQPQYDNHQRCIGAESLLRWNHPLYGMIYPPLVIQIARECDILPQLEEYVLKYAVRDARSVREKTGFD